MQKGFIILVLSILVAGLVGCGALGGADPGAPPVAEQPPVEEPPVEQPPAEQPPADDAGTPTANTWLFLLLGLGGLAIVVVILFMIMQGSRREPATAQATVNVGAPPPPVTAVPPPASQGGSTRRSIFVPGTATIPPFEAPEIYDRSYWISVDLQRASPDAEGVLFALGSSQAGYGMYIQNNRLIYEMALGDATNRIVSTREMPLGRSTVRYAFTRSGPYQGTGTLFIDDQQVGTAFFERNLSIPPSEGLDIGLDRGLPLTQAYEAPFPFSGTVERVIFDLEAPRG